ncbi:MAG TPA: hypothetical protein VF331_27590 [Polyangiales bacterium]
MAQLRAVLDFLLRAAFFALAPFGLVFVALLFPVTGAIVQIGLALATFFAGEAVRRLAGRSKLAAALLSSQLQFEAYYRAHPVRPFLYYVAYPLLFPYWLTVQAARREFLLYKGYTLLSFALMLLSLGYQYFSLFPPELGFRQFLPIAAGSLAAEAAVVLMFLLPIVTSAMHFHQQRAPRRLAVLLLVGLVSVGAAAVRLERRRDPIVSFATRTRVRLRSAAKPWTAQAAQAKALRAAWAALSKEKDDIDTDGKVQDEALEAAHTALVGFYRNDEAHSFDLWYTRTAGRAIMVLYFEARRGHPPIWLAMERRGKTTHDVQQLPRGAFVAMKHATE